MEGKLAWFIFFKISFWPNYISRCTECTIKIIKDNPWPLYKITMIEPCPQSLININCSHSLVNPWPLYKTIPV